MAGGKSDCAYVFGGGNFCSPLFTEQPTGKEYVSVSECCTGYPVCKAACVSAQRCIARLQKIYEFQKFPPTDPSSGKLNFRRLRHFQRGNILGNLFGIPRGVPIFPYVFVDSKKTPLRLPRTNGPRLLRKAVPKFQR